MTILKLHIDYTNPLTKEVYGNYSNWKLFCILRRYLEPRKRSLSLKEAVTLIYNILIPVIPGKPVEYPVEAFGFVILSVARQVPYFHISQDRFVRLLEQVHQFIELDLTNKLETETFHFALESVVRAAREIYNEPSKKLSLEYLNLTSFFARLASSGILGSSWAVITMREVLEQEISKETDSYNYHIAQAALWIHHYGPCLYYAICHSPLRKSRRVEEKFRAGSLYNGSTFSVERWNFWRDAFAFAVKGGNLNDESRDLALNALLLMDEIAAVGVEAR